MMDTVFGQFIRQGWVLVYIDDVIIFSDDSDTHIKQIGIILQTVIDAGLKISIQK